MRGVSKQDLPEKICLVCRRPFLVLGAVEESAHGAD